MQFYSDLSRIPFDARQIYRQWSCSKAAIKSPLTYKMTKEINCSAACITQYSQLSSSGHLAITDTPIIRTAAKLQRLD